MSRTAWTIRPFRSSDAEAVAQLCREAILQTGRRAYSAQQVQVWSSFTSNVEVFAERLRNGVTFVAEVDGEVAAIAQLQPLNHIELLYTLPGYGRRGLAAALIAQLEAAARGNQVTKVITEASHLARPVFERAGFHVVEPEYVERGGLMFERFKMAKRLAAGMPGTC